jgi:hypothetical protein
VAPDPSVENFKSESVLGASRCRSASLPPTVSLLARRHKDMAKSPLKNNYTITIAKEHGTVRRYTRQELYDRRILLDDPDKQNVPETFMCAAPRLACRTCGVLGDG